MKELVSIIMPAYNAAKHIKETIDSVLAQTYSHWELIIVDDGSVDNTKQLVEDYCAKDSRIKYIYQKNARQGRARNNGITHSTGKYVAFLDSDDLWLPEKLLVQLRELAAQKADLIFTDSFVFTDDTTPSQRLATTLPRMHTERGTFSGEEGTAFFLASNRIPILTVLATRSALVAVGGFTENPLVQNAEDYHLWVKMLLADYTLVGLDYTLAAYRKHSSSVSDTDGQNLRQVVEAKIDLAKNYPEKSALILASIRRSIVVSLAQISKYPNERFFDTLDRYLTLSAKYSFRPVFRGFQKLGLRSLALKTSYFVFNYL